jgi:2-oxoacid:acceptor oxidoreductase gamma subunit (pyruvate/2-ketoisovalerate family)
VKEGHEKDFDFQDWKPVLTAYRNVYQNGCLFSVIKACDRWRKPDMTYFQDVRWHGRGGQGAWTASELLARAAVKEGKYIQSFPEFGPERMGAPVRAYTRISDGPINLHCAIYEPDVVAILDASLIKTVPVTEGLQDDGILTVNTRESPTELRKRLDLRAQKVWTASATDIAVEILGRPIANTAMLGTLARATGIVSLKSLGEAVKERFPLKIAEKNVVAMKRAYEEARSG